MDCFATIIKINDIYRSFNLLTANTCLLRPNITIVSDNTPIPSDDWTTIIKMTLKDDVIDYAAMQRRIEEADGVFKLVNINTPSDTTESIISCALRTSQMSTALASGKIDGAMSLVFNIHIAGNKMIDVNVLFDNITVEHVSNKICAFLSIVSQFIKPESCKEQYKHMIVNKQTNENPLDSVVDAIRLTSTTICTAAEVRKYICKAPVVAYGFDVVYDMFLDRVVEKCFDQATQKMDRAWLKEMAFWKQAGNVDIALMDSMQFAPSTDEQENAAVPREKRRLDLFLSGKRQRILGYLIKSVISDCLANIMDPHLILKTHIDQLVARGQK